MFPSFEIFSTWILVYTFWITLTICFFAFLWNLQRLAKRFWYSFSFFSQNILWFFLSVFIFSRAFYVIGQWHDMKFIQEPIQFFIMNEYSFSLFGAIFGFWIVMKILARLERSSISRYIDGVVLSFLFIMIIGYVWSLLWGQVYGKPTDFGIEISYTNPFSEVKYQVPVFPLPVIYAFFSFLIFSGLYILSLFLHIRGFIWYMWLILFSAMIIIFESFSGKQDILSVSSIFNLTQIYAFILIVWSTVELYRISKSDSNPAQI